jgi:hypothetical protein
MKKNWNNPKFDVLNVENTLASTVHGPYTDEAYVPGEPVDEDDPGTWRRFTS